MFPFFPKVYATTLTHTDIHSHLIPSIDDGAMDMEESIELVEELYLFGYRRLVVTPHVNDIYDNSREKILKGYRNLINEIDKKSIEIEIIVGAEYYADSYFETFLEKEKLLSFGKENYLLFEFPHDKSPLNIKRVIEKIKSKGYTPLLAHPERYSYFYNNINIYRELKRMGVLFQININSIVGYYDNRAKECVKSLIDEGMVDFIGSDTHHIKHIESLKKSFGDSLYRKIFKKNIILNDIFELEDRIEYFSSI